MLTLLPVLLCGPAHAAVTADAGPDQMAYPGETVVLAGSGSGAAFLSYTWSQVGGPPVTFDPTDVTPTFSVHAEGMYVFQLVVDDGAVASEPDAVVISVVRTDIREVVEPSRCATSPAMAGLVVALALAWSRRR